MSTPPKAQMDLYIYYRVRSENAEALKTRALAMQQALIADYGIVAGLKRRPEEKDGQQTWMEIYQLVPKDFEVTLKNAVEQNGLSSLIDGQRHIEYFLDVSSCA